MTSPNRRKHLGGNHRVVGSVSGLAIRGCGAAGSDPSGESSKCPKSFRVAHLMWARWSRKQVNMGKTKIMKSGINLDVLKKSGKYPCGVCQSGVGSSNAIFCGGCKRWVHKKCSGINGPLRPDPEFRCTRCLGTAWAIDEREVSEVEVRDEKA